MLQIRKYTRGQYLYRQGSKCDKMYIVREGEFAITKSIDNVNKDEDGQITNPSLNFNKLRKKTDEVRIGMLG